MSINVIDATNFIKDAFYAMPVFSDGNGNNISGVYGALYKLKSMLSENEEALFAFSFEKDNESEYTPAVVDQTEKFAEILKMQNSDLPLSIDYGEIYDSNKEKYDELIEWCQNNSTYCIIR